MEQCKIDFESMPWEKPAVGVRSKTYKHKGKQLRLLEFSEELVEINWCTRGHIGYILEGQLEINFNGNIMVFNKGDGVFIPAGETDKHMGRALTKVVKMIFVEDVF